MRQTDTGALIAQLRKEQGLTQKQLAEQLHISDRTISKWAAGGRVSRCISAGTAGRCAALLGGKSSGGTAGGGTAEIDVRSALAVLIRESRSALRRDWSRRFRDTLLSAGSGLCDLWNFGSQQRVSSKGRAVLYSWNLAGWRENRRNSRYDFRGTKHLGTELRWAVCHRRSGENLSGTHAGNDPLGEEKQLRQYHIC